MASTQDPWRPTSADFGVDNGTPDIALILHKKQQGLYLTPQEQAIYDAHVQEGTDRANGGGSASNGQAGTGFYRPGGPASTVTNLLVPNGGLPKDPLGTPGINDGQSFSTTGVGALGGGGSSTPSAPRQVFDANGNVINPTAAGAGAMNPNDPLTALINEARANRQENVGFIDNTLTPQLNGIHQLQAGVLGNQVNQDQVLTDSLNGWVKKAGTDAQNANDMSFGGLVNYGNQISGINASNDSYVDDLARTYGGMSQLSPTHQVANQQAETAQLYQAALARAQANPNDVQAQKDVLALSRRISEGSNDVRNGGLTPEAMKAQLSALSQYGALTSPEVTAKERFLYESQRMQQEQQQKASTDALMDSYRVKGMGGSGMELGNILASGQKNSQERLLGDLGTQAGAVDRSMQALQGYGELSTQMMGQGNQVDQFNKSQRLQGLGLSADMANNIAANSQQLSEFNAGQENQVNVANAGFANDNAQFNAGQRNIVNMNNLNQNMAQGQFEDTYRATQQQNAAARASTLANTGLTKNANNATNLGNVSTAFQTGLNDASARNNKVTGLGMHSAETISDAGRQTNNTAINLGNTWGGQGIAVADLRGRTSSSGSAAVQEGLKAQAGSEAADKAAGMISAKRPFDVTDPSTW